MSFRIPGSLRRFGRLARLDEAPLPRGHLWGLTLSNGTDADHDIDIAVGECRDSANGVNLNLIAALGKQIDATWTAGGTPGTPAGGLFTGTVANGTTYHVFLIRKDSDGSLDAGFDTSVSAANIPSGYTAYRRLGSVITDGSANILAFSQLGDEFLLSLTIASTDTVSTTPALFDVTVPADIQVWWLGIIYTAASALTFITSPDVTSETATGARNQNIADTSVMETRHRTNTSAQLRAVTNTGGGTSVVLSTRGWIDDRGRSA